MTGSVSHTLEAALQRTWRRRSVAAYLLWPFGLAYCAVAVLRRLAYRYGLLTVTRLPVPVVVVGNLTVGGTGKTPLVIRLTEHLRDVGFRPGVVSRGYGGAGRAWPYLVTAATPPGLVGDEPVVIARRTGCPVIVDPDRPRAANALVEGFDCDIVVSDDGLQHYALGRTVEVAVIDGTRRFGNGLCLPAGPMREPSSRLAQTDMVVCNGGIPAAGEFAMTVVAAPPVRVADCATAADLARLRAQPVHAFAGIGSPERFFDSLRGLGLTVREHPLPDHHRYRPADLDVPADAAILMTEKDAVKCVQLDDGRMWFVPVNAELGAEFFAKFTACLAVAE